MSWLPRALFFVGALLLAPALAVPILPNVAAEPRYDTSTVGEPSHGELFQQILDQLRENNVKGADMPSDEELFQIAIGAIMKTLGDRHGRFFTPQQHQAFQESHAPTNYSGVGIKIAAASGGVIILEIFDNSPLKLMNVKVGDTIVGAGDLGGEMIEWTITDGRPNLREMVGAIKGPTGTDVNLKIKRGTTELGVITVQRVQTRKQDIYMAKDEHGILTIRINEYTQTLYDDLKAMLDEEGWLYPEGDLNTGIIKGVVLDLRWNPGGSLRSAVSLGDAFLPKGVTVVRVIQPPNEESEGRAVAIDFKTNEDRLFPMRIPRVVLGNGGSASASEINIGAFVHYKEMPFFGTKTFGKGSVQTIIPLAGGAAVKTTTAIYLAGGVMEIDGVGIEPTSPVAQPATPGLSQDHKRINAHIIKTSMDPEIDYQLAVAKKYIMAFLTGEHSMASTGSVSAATQKAHGAAKAVFNAAFCKEKGLRGCPTNTPGFMGTPRAP